MKFDFYYGNAGEQFRFLRIPKPLFEEATFSGLSTDSKVLYGLMLDRMSLSRKCHWIDAENHVYIEYRSETIMSSLGISKNTVTKLLNELDDFGLIQRKRRGQGKPTVYYVMDFASVLQVHSSPKPKRSTKNAKSRVPHKANQEAQKLGMPSAEAAPVTAECAKPLQKSCVPHCVNQESQNLGVLIPSTWESCGVHCGNLSSHDVGTTPSYYNTETELNDTEGVRLSETPSTQNAEDNYFDAIRTAFETSCPSLKAPVPVSQWSRKRKRSLLDKHLSVADFKALCSQIEASDFLTGRKAGKDGTMFLASFGWVLKNWESIAEGSYANYQQPVHQTAATSFDLEAYERDSMFDTCRDLEAVQ